MGEVGIINVNCHMAIFFLQQEKVDSHFTTTSVPAVLSSILPLPHRLTLPLLLLPLNVGQVTGGCGRSSIERCGFIAQCMAAAGLLDISTGMCGGVASLAPELDFDLSKCTVSRKAACRLNVPYSNQN